MKTQRTDYRAEFRKRFRYGEHEALNLDVVCPKCRRPISSAMPWRCGRCQFDNRRTDIYSFLYKCQKCEEEPLGVECPRCGGIVYLTEERRAPFVAAAIPQTIQKEDPDERERKAHAKSKERLQRKIEIAELNAKLTQAGQAAESKPKDLEAVLVEQLEADLKKGMALEAAIAKVKHRIAEDFKDDDDSREKYDLWIEGWRERKIQQLGG